MNAKFLLYLLVVLLAGLIIHGPTIQYPGFLQSSTHDGFLATGDHGRDLYAFYQTMQGKRPFQDYSWVYGPLMPYYYGLMMKAFGATLQVVYTAQLALQLVAGVLFFLLCARLMPLPLSLIGSVWFLFFNQNFYHTYNNTGGQVLILAVLFCLFAYLQNDKKAFFFAAQPLLVLLMLVKFNIGVAVLIAYYLSVVLARAYLKKINTASTLTQYGIGLVTVLLAAGLGYRYFLHGLSQELIYQYFPLFDKSHTRMQPLGENVAIFLKLYGSYFFSSKVSFLLALLTLSAAARTGADLYRQRYADELSRMTGVTLLVLGIFYLSLLHEYLLTGIFYRVFWSVPLTILFFFFFLHKGTQHLSVRFKWSLWTLLLVILTTQFIDRYRHFERVKSEHRQYWDHPKARLFINNESAWTEVVNGAAAFIEANLKPTETFLALPYDPMYYFLTARESPVTRLVFYAYAAPTADEEQRIINTLHEKNVDWIVVSNTIRSDEESLGTFGVTHCLELAKYIAAHFVPVATFGDFDRSGGWSGQYAVRILKRQYSSNGSLDDRINN